MRIMKFYGLIVNNECIEVVRWRPEVAKAMGNTSEPRIWDFKTNHDPDMPHEIKELKIAWE